MATSKRINKSGPVTYQIQDKVAVALWALVGTFQHQDWEVPKDRQLLASIAGIEATDAFYNITDTKVQNVHLRTLLREPLRSINTQKRHAAVKWVVYDWGNIPPQAEGEEDRLYSMCDELKKYDDAHVKLFVEKYNNVRIASWSKVLAFANSDEYAIFDARVAMTLNALLFEIGHQRKFFMPPSISKPLNKVFSTIRQQVKIDFDGKKHSYMGYLEYTALLKKLVTLGLVSSVLEAEMRLFAQGKKMANHFAAKHYLEIPYPDEA
jgi:hypothetical protein